MKTLEVTVVSRWANSELTYNPSMFYFFELLYKSGFNLTHAHYTRPDIMILHYDGDGLWIPCIRRENA